ncbi:MAG: ATP-dependent Clp protease ATP-binding subunit [Candidatus Pacebacteria bacterium]|nr:ATP-dependent Clp protease ATP-binding subunit [Candidatus Paceibacterota bacterium]
MERFISRRALHVLRTIFLVGVTFSGSLAIVFYFFFDDAVYQSISLGAFFIFFALWVEQILIFSYHNSFFFRGLNSVIGIENEPVSGATYDLAKVGLSDPQDITKAFCTSPFGSITLLRAGVSFEALDAFLAAPRQTVTAEKVVLPEDKIFTLIDLGKYLLSQDQSFKDLFVKQGITTETYFGALYWVIGSYHQEKRLLRFWSKDNLSRTKGLGREWTYGIAYLLEQYEKDIRTSAVFSTLTRDSAYASEKVGEIETALAKMKASNVLILGEPGVGKIDLVMEIKRRIENGKSLDAISGKHIILLDMNRVFATHREKQALEVTMLNIFDEALHSGNTVIVIENLSTVIREAEAMGVFLPELLDEYLSSPLLQVIATDTPGGFHNFLEPLGAFTRRFTEVLIETPDVSATVRLLQGIAVQNEIRFRTLFTYSALEAIATAADRHIVEGVMPDKAITLLADVAAHAEQTNTETITADVVYSVVGEKTGIPAGPIQDSERDLLLHLEDTLHQQVIGQEHALSAIARTMRRARAGIQSNEKPIGSFLFLGPTGVGKTETAKALAKVFFGSENKMHRIDMSEFSGNDALERLLGDGATSGILPDMLREHPYSVLLLDELEKGAQTVHDLFLQILDEGVFTDARGEKVNARNTIVIATSNAGSRLIMDTVEQRKALHHLSQEIIDHIIREGIFRPELINRFDSTIIFEPLSVPEQTQVASLMLGGLYSRMKERGYELVVGNELLEVLVTKGYNPEFGARPMQRVLQDVIEEKVAQKIISGAVKRGDTITLNKEDFTEEELSVTGI